VKMGLEAATEALRWGVNDLGGTLMEENISRMAGSRHGVRLEPEPLRRPAGGAGQEFCGGERGRLAGSNDSGARDFSTRLRAVAAVSEEGRSAPIDQQSPCAAGKAAKITDVGEMSYEEPVQLVLCERVLKAALAAGVIHGEECSKKQFSTSVLGSRFPVLSSQFFDRIHIWSY